MQCREPNCNNAPTHGFVWAWGNSGQVCAAHIPHLQTLAGQLNREVRISPLLEITPKRYRAVLVDGLDLGTVDARTEEEAKGKAIALAVRSGHEPQEIQVEPDDGAGDAGDETIPTSTVADFETLRVEHAARTAELERAHDTIGELRQQLDVHGRDLAELRNDKINLIRQLQTNPDELAAARSRILDLEAQLTAKDDVIRQLQQPQK